MGNRDERLRTLLQRLTSKVGDAELSDYVLNVVARRCDCGAVVEPRDDPGNRTLCRRGGKRDDRFASLGAPGSSYEINLTTDTAVLHVADHLGIHLPTEIDLHC